MKRAIAGLCLLFSALGFAVGFNEAQDSQPTCPTDDSCTVDYHDGEWHILEGS